jgi:hypothetical protein
MTIFTRVRGELKTQEKSGVELGHLLNARITKRIRSLFVDEEVKSHDLRRLYADLSYKLFADPAKTSQQAYLSSILGHDSDDVAKYYSTVDVDINGIPREEFVPEGDVVAAPQMVDVPRNLEGVRDGKGGERLAATVAALVHNGEKVTSKKLAELGYGRRAVSEYLSRK